MTSPRLERHAQPEPRARYSERAVLPFSICSSLVDLNRPTECFERWWVQLPAAIQDVAVAVDHQASGNALAAERVGEDEMFIDELRVAEAALLRKIDDPVVGFAPPPRPALGLARRPAG